MEYTEAVAVPGGASVPTSVSAPAVPGDEPCSGSCDAARITFPQSFILRIIYRIDGEDSLKQLLPDILAAHAVPATEPGYAQVGSGRYGRASVSATLTNLDQMRAVYAAIGAIDCVKAVV